MKLLLAASLTLAATLVAEDKPEALLVAAKKIASENAWKVQAMVNGDESFKLFGIVSGSDFDLTIRTAKGHSRQIVVGEKAWSSSDGGKTWKPVKKVDRRYYHISHTPIFYRESETIPPFEKVGVVDAGGESLTHIRFASPQAASYEGDRPNVWLGLKDGTPTAVRRYLGPLGFEGKLVTADVHYKSPTDSKGVLPPPGNPDAGPVDNPADVWLAAAQKKMSIGVWAVKGAAAGPKTINISGLLNGRDFDLTMGGEEPIRQIGIKDKSWLSKDGGKTWQSTSANDRLLFNLSQSPLVSDRMHPDFEDAGREEHDGETWQHVRLKIAEKLESEDQRPHYWIAMDAKGEPIAIRRYHGAVWLREGVVECKFDYAPSDGKTINKPPLKK